MVSENILTGKEDKWFLKKLFFLIFYSKIGSLTTVANVVVL